MLESKSVIAVPPGATIREQLEYRKMSQKDFAKRMGLTEKHISRLINGKVELTQEVALRLESVFGIPASFWNNLESIYREQAARAIAENELDADTEIAKKFPYSEMVKLGWVPATTQIKDKVAHLRSFFEVARLGILDDLRVPGIAYRRVGETTESNYALAAWAQKARLEARNVSVSPINTTRLKEIIPDIRSLTTQDPSVFCPKLEQLLGECGIVIVFLPHLSGSFLHGATFVDGSHIVMGLTVRGRTADRFWFSLFHEINHILSGHIYNADTTLSVFEQEAESDRFARDTLISPKDYDDFIRSGQTSRSAIIEFANEISIDPGIVVGRLQKENIIPYEWHNGLKTHYIIKS